MRDEAKANEDADKAAKEKVDKLNAADQMIFQTEKQMAEFGDKLPADKKQPIEDAIAELKKAHEAQDIPGYRFCYGNFKSDLPSGFSRDVCSI